TPASELLGRTNFNRLPEETARQLRQNDLQVLSSGQAQQFEEVVPAPDGSLHHELVVKFPLTDTDGKRLLAGVAVDITERKRAEAEQARLAAQVENERQRLDNIVTSVPGVVWEAWGQPDAATQRTDFVSDYVETLLGYSVEEWLATPNFWLTIVHPDDKERIARESAAIFASGAGGSNQFRWMTKDERAVWVESQ